ncbi:serine/threonine protein phosphatase [Leptospira congkakensis]|uniref:Serine/threonine protein phosphatase n=1 Tax=Leptospira congkakensis TaxID=2484932 RepID=A0A4Z1ABI2_9LEPT|nr:PP2C family protein-serine/threonine phosphatase [Leptospira congkakensis]TGL86825.1 serine/threonine protein phosphatase [Leptospira congkakensis]TGL93631.1 serine/threonine protein phosphatase [Leptospira congkakensis]TGL94963.1 serine/threonine protein phosphatase [Leptospira congkakensis]
MRELTITILSSLLFFLILLLAFIGFQNNNKRLPFYHYPSGLIVNIGEGNRTHWGNSVVQEDLEKFESITDFTNIDSFQLHIKDSNNVVYEENFRLTTVRKTDVLGVFFSDLFLAFFSLAIAVYFYYSTRDALIFGFFLNFGLVILSNVFVLTFKNSTFLFILTLYLGSFLQYHLIYRLRGKEINSKWLLPQVLISFIMAMIASQEKYDMLLVERVVLVAHAITVLFGSINIIANIYEIVKSKPQEEALIKRIVLVISIFLYVALPFSILFFDGYPWFFVHRSFFIVTYLLFILSFFYGTYRYTFVPSLVIFTPSIVTLILVLIILGTYIGTVFVLDFVLPIRYLKDRWVFNLIYLFLVTAYLIPLKLRVKEFFDYWFFEQNPKLSEGINQITALLSSPLSMRKTILTINRTVKDTVNVSNIIILIPGDQFASTDLKNIDFVRISPQSEIWNYFTSTDRVTVTSHLEYGIGLRETLYNFLKGLNVQLAFPAYDSSSNKKNIQAMILIGEKLDKKYFSIGELKFINEVVKISGMLLENYSLLEDEIQKRKIVRDIQTASIVDNTLRLILPSEVKGIDYGYISKPAVGISGDYLDIIPISQTKMIVLLGDVAGHGLGTGFLVSAIKGIVREQLRNGTSLEGLFREINSFFRARYKGNEFMTLLGGIFDSKENIFKYVNAGHLSLIEMRADGQIKLHSKTQRVLGILETDYHAQELKLLPGTKLFLYSDGITEAFSERDEIFGEETLIEFLHFNAQKTVKEIPTLLETKMTNFRGNREQSDDITFIGLSFTPN